MDGNGRLIRPGEVKLGVMHHPGPLAEPTSIQMQSAAGVEVHTFGGLTKVEALAGTVAAGILSGYMSKSVYREKLAQDAVAIANDILAECERQAKQAANEDLSDL